MTGLALLGILNVFDLLRAACGCLHWRSARLILKPFKYSDRGAGIAQWLEHRTRD